MSEPVTAAAVDAHEIAVLRNAVDESLRRLGADRALRTLGPLAAAPSDRAKIVVAGEIGTGKTSVINALLNRPDLLPCERTTTYVGVGAGESEQLRVHRHNNPVLNTSTTEIRRWLASPSDSEDVERAEILLADPRLARLTLFDTPGVGAGAGGAALCLETLQHATAMVFVCSAEAKISIAERTFLAQAAARVDHVVFLLNKVDLLADLGADNLEENEHTVRTDNRRFPHDRFAELTFLPFSAMLAAEGLHGDDQALADSGLGALWARLDRIALRHAQFAQLNDLRAIKSAITEGFQVLAARKAAIAGPADSQIDMEQLNIRINELREQGARWRILLSRQVELARSSLQKELRRRVRRLLHDYQLRMSTLKHKEIADAQGEATDAMCALAADIDAVVRDHVVEIARRLMLGLPGAEDAVAALAQRLPPPEETPSEFLAERPPPPKDPAEGLLGIQTVFVGDNIGKSVLTAVLSGSGAAASSVVTIAALPVGGALYLLHRRARRRAADLASLRSWLSTSIHDTAGELGAQIDETLIRARHELEDAVETAVRDALAEATGLSRTLSQAANDLKAEQKRIEDQGAELYPLTQKCNQLRSSLVAITAPGGETR